VVKNISNNKIQRKNQTQLVSENTYFLPTAPILYLFEICHRLENINGFSRVLDQNFVKFYKIILTTFLK
jgi:hypothetical protein